MRYARVIVDIAHANVDRIFDYMITEDISGDIVGYRAKVPFGHRMIEGFVVGVSDHSDVPEGKLKAIHSIIDDQPVLLPHLMDLAKWMRDTYRSLLVDTLRVMIPAQMRGGRVKEKLIRYVKIKITGDELETARGKLTRAKKQLIILNYIVEQGGQALVSEINETFGAASSYIKALSDKGYIDILEKRSYRKPYQSIQREHKEANLATEDQQAAIETIVQSIDKGQGEFLLHGVTGSGKTEVYMQCARYALDQDKTVIILVPEISLTPQMVRRFTARFGDKAAVLHSRLSAGERFDEWQRIREGEATVVIGARSAIFAPIQNLGLVVIDEEHESSYRSDHAPRYSAIEVARQRCADEGGVLILGSATPSVIRYHRAQQGFLHLLELPDRIGSALMPETTIVDMREELKQGNRSIISQMLYNELKGCFERGEQAICFLNRRGFSTFVSCRNCGYVCECDLCELPMTYHRPDDTLRCHYCGDIQPSPSICPSCGSKHIRFFGGGTQKVEEEIKKLFPNVKTLRMDADTTTKKDSHLKILDAFSRQEAQVLIGTQMIAKGLHYPNVTVVGIIAADRSLYVNDYRSAERTFQLVAQVAGRAGRDRLSGRVVVQTYSPEHYSILAAADHDYKRFYEEEIALRQAAYFPPFAQFVRWVVVNENQATAKDDAHRMLHKMEQTIEENPLMRQCVLMLEATPAPLQRIKARYRYQVILKYIPEVFGEKIMEAFASLKDACPGDSMLTLEIDPTNMI